jgi:hypothetical protein
MLLLAYFQAFSALENSNESFRNNAGDIIAIPILPSYGS